MKQIGMLIRLALFAAGLAAIAWLGLQLRDKWAREAQQRAEPAAAQPAADEPAN